jgi:hypothetical protein
MTAPLESVTVPKTVASSLCGQAQAGSNANERTKRKHAPELKNAADQARACVRSMKERGSEGVGLWRSLVLIESIRRAAVLGEPLATGPELYKKMSMLARACGPHEFRKFDESHEFRNLDSDSGICSAKFELELVDFQDLDARLKSRWWNSELSCRS